MLGSLAILAACGGGSNSPTVTTYPVDLAISDFYQMSHRFTLHASSGSDNYGLDIAITPGGQASFQGVQGMTDKNTSSESKNGTVLGTNTSTDYFLTTPYTQLGTTFSSGLVILDSDQQALPEFAEVGASGKLDSQKYYSDSSLGSQIGTGNRSWTLASLTSDTAQFCIHDTDDLGGSPETEVDCYDLDAKGNVTAIQITIVNGGQTLTFK
jgi:hypothetical protein